MGEHKHDMGEHKCDMDGHKLNMDGYNCDMEEACYYNRQSKIKLKKGPWPHDQMLNKAI